MSQSRLYGRAVEILALASLLEDATEGGGALVLRGEAGIGKSALLREVSRHAVERGMHVLATTCVQSEAHLPFAGLHHSLRPLLREMGNLPPPQRGALATAFGMSENAAPDVFRIALGVLDLLAEAASSAPIVLVVDDAHWLDPASCDVLRFVARRIDFDPIVLFFGVRDGVDSRFVETELPELRLGPLGEVAAGMLLDATAPELAHHMRRRILEAAEGNPLSLVELPHAVGAERFDPSPLPDPVPITDRLERVFAAGLSELPAAARTLLLVAALDDSGDVRELLAAATVIEQKPVPLQTAAPAAEARLVEIREDGLRFRHPLIRSAVFQAASVPDRHAVHAAVAEVLADQPERRSWHRAAACLGTDEVVASELEQAAERAQRRGATSVAVAALERAATLSDDDTQRARRLLLAAELAFELGRNDLLLRLVHDVEALELGLLERGRLMLIRERAAEQVSVEPAWVHSLLGVAEAARVEGDSKLAVGLLWVAASRCYWTDPDAELRLSVVDAAERLGSVEDDPRIVGIFAFAAPIECGRAVIDHLRDAAVAPVGVMNGRVARARGAAAHAVGAFDLASDFFGQGIADLRQEGRLALLARALVLQSRSEIHLGHLDKAVILAEEGSRLAAETGEPLWVAGARTALAITHAMRGDEDLAKSHAAAAERIALPLGAGAILGAVQLARGLLSLAHGRHDEAYGELRRMFDPADPSYHVMERSWAIGELADAALHAGRHDAARALLAEVEALAAQTPSPRLHVALRFARPLLSGDADADSLFQDALDAQLAIWPFDRARLLLAYGAWLRRQRRVAESRTRLRAAREAFDAIGAAIWSERARQELRASGESSRRPVAMAREHLTPQELEIARMAAEGLTNREIGQRLYLSHRTVGSHLYRIFPKLGVTSRNQLRSVLTLP
ncbi:MAG: LuxR family transcriptional regulator [Actinomycetia bacterium]|nr:LuxR family transcriptional regulator [Actinomycetes bacterium]